MQVDSAEQPRGNERLAVDRDFAVTLAKGMEILRCFTSDEAVLSNAEIARKTGLTRPTVSRFAYTLCALGYLRPDAASGKYRLGAAVLTLGHALLASIRIRQMARPYMHELAESVEGAVSMGARDRLSIVYVETCRSQRVRGAALSDIGMTHPIMSSAIGRAYLAGCGSADRERLLNEIRIKAPDLWARFEHRTKEELERFKQSGFCVSVGEISPDRYAVAAPLSIAVDAERLVFNCTMYSHSTSVEALTRDIGPRLKRTVDSIRSRLESEGAWSP